MISLLSRMAAEGGQDPSVNIKHMSVDEVGCFGRQEDSCSGQLLRPAPPAGGSAFDDELVEGMSPHTYGSRLYALVAGFCYALYIITTRKLSLSGPPLLTLFYTAIVGTLVLGPMAVLDWVVPDLVGILMAAAMGLVAAISHFMIIKAFECATASELSPFGYFEIIVAIVLSYFVFKFVPTPEAVTGLIIIIISGLFVSWRAMKNNRAITKESESVIEML